MTDERLELHAQLVAHHGGEIRWDDQYHDWNLIHKHGTLTLSTQYEMAVLRASVFLALYYGGFTFDESRVAAYGVNTL